MSQLIFHEEWIVAKRLTEKTGLSERQIKAYRQARWAEGFHFKKVPMAVGTDSDKGLIWYNLPRINQFIQEF